MTIRPSPVVALNRAIAVAQNEGPERGLEEIRSIMILDGTVVRVRLDRKATSIVLLVVLGVRQDGQKEGACLGDVEVAGFWRLMAQRHIGFASREVCRLSRVQK